jgi:polyhydroxyalkanoate synthesis repressor PhaR
MGKKRAEGEPITIKKYANRRLYNTDTSSYITLDDLADMVRANSDFVVVDAKSGNDITHSILTQIIVEQEASGGKQMLPVSFLRDLISMYGNSMQNMMPSYLEASMENFRKNSTQLASALKSGNPIAQIAETNMAMVRAATDALMPKTQAEDENSVDELAELREQMANMQKKLDALDK